MAIFAMNHLLSWTTVLVALFLLLSAKVIYQLYFHPLAKFPGPKLAAITTWYEGYYDIVKKGRYTFELARLHDKYGKSSRLKRICGHGSNSVRKADLINQVQSSVLAPMKFIYETRHTTTLFTA